MLINPSGRQNEDEQNLHIVINELNFNEIKKGYFFNYLNNSSPFLSLIIMSIFIIANHKLVNEYENDFFKFLNSIFLD